MKREISIEGNLAYIPLTRGFMAVVDAVDVPLVRGHCWTAGTRRRNVYAFRTIATPTGATTLYMHRVLISPPPGMQVDHIDGDGLNNRRANLRIVTAAQNNCNIRLTARNRSGVKGVSWCSRDRKWQAHIMVNKKSRGLGRFNTIEEAAAAYAEASADLHGPYGRISGMGAD
jgi:hypothetical protein